MSDNFRKAPFLVTTALEDFWQPDQKIVFLSEACRLFSRREYWSGLDAVVLDYVWKDSAQLATAQNYLPGVCDHCLDVLSGWLNQVHRTNFSTRYWQIIIGPFVFFYTHALYDRYVSLLNAFSRYPDVRTLGLHTDEYLTPISTLEFVEMVANSDRYNLQLYTQIINEIRPSLIVYQRLRSIKQNASPDRQAQGARESLQAWLKRSLVALNNRFLANAPVTLYAGTAPVKERLRISFCSKGVVWSIFNPGKQKDASLPVDRCLRTGLAGQISQDPFIRILLKSLIVNFPVQFLEAYPGLVRSASANFCRKPKCIASDIGWYFDEPFKAWAAKRAEEGCKLVAVQHGGAYGDALYSFHESHEKRIADAFISWGWQDGSKVVPLPSLRLAGRSRCRSTNLKNILWTSTALPRYNDPFTHTHLEYLEMEFKFVENLEQRVIDDLLLRLYVYDYGWSTKERWHARFPALKLQEPRQARNFGQVLAGCRLYVGDNPYTTFLEALALNKPTLLFWSNQRACHRAVSLPYYDQLRQAGIFHDTPESAAQKLNTIYPCIEEWWQQGAIQDARAAFCERFARTSDQWIKSWLLMFRSLSS